MRAGFHNPCGFVQSCKKCWILGSGSGEKIGNEENWEEKMMRGKNDARKKWGKEWGKEEKNEENKEKMRKRPIQN